LATGAEPHVVWINGAFGVGKTAVAEELAAMLPGSIVFDPEPHGDLLRRALPVAEQPDDFQDLPAWRELTRATAGSLATTRGGLVVVPMTIVEHAYFDEVMGGLQRDGIRVLHISLIAPAQVVASRLRGREGNNDWALDRVERCVAALTDERFAEHVAASAATPRELAEGIRGRIDARTGGLA
jgi:predicted kinase